MSLWLWVAQSAVEMALSKLECLVARLYTCYMASPHLQEPVLGQLPAAIDNYELPPTSKHLRRRLKSSTVEATMESVDIDYELHSTPSSSLSLVSHLSSSVSLVSYLSSSVSLVSHLSSSVSLVSHRSVSLVSHPSNLVILVSHPSSSVSQHFQDYFDDKYCMVADIYTMCMGLQLVLHL